MNRPAAVAPIIPVPQTMGKDSAHESARALAEFSPNETDGPFATLSSSIKSAAISNSFSSMCAILSALATISNGVVCVHNEARGLRPFASIAKCTAPLIDSESFSKALPPAPIVMTRAPRRPASAVMLKVSSVAPEQETPITTSIGPTQPGRLCVCSR